MLNDMTEEIMAITQEECAEVVQAISKCFRFGFNDVYDGKTNQQRLEEELGDLKCMISLMEEKGIINGSRVYDAEVNKRDKLTRWSKYFVNEEASTIN